MTERTFEIDHYWHDSVGGECSGKLVVTYTVHKGFAGDRNDPPEPASIEFDVSTDAPERTIDRELVELECWEHAASEAAAAEEYRADQRRDDLMMERF